MYYYILNDDREPVPVDGDRYSQFCRDTHGDPIRVAYDEHGDVFVSTVFLGISHGGTVSRPVIFETMIFGGDHDQWMNRYCTWDEAKDGHKRACRLAFGDDYDAQTD